MPPVGKIVTETGSLSVRFTAHCKIDQALLGLFTVALVFGAAFYLSPQFRAQFTGQSVSEQSEPVSTPESIETLGGRIYLSLKSNDAHDTAKTLDLYSFDIGTDELSVVLAEAGQHTMTSRISPDGTQVAFASVGEDHSDIMRLFVSDKEMRNMEEIAHDDDLVIKRNPVWSHDGTRIAFAAKDNSDGDDVSVESWGVYVYETSTLSLDFVSKGTNPIFLPDDSLLILKNDGIHRVVQNTGADTLVLPASDPRANMRFDVSPDGTKLAWVLPIIDRINILEISSLEPFVATPMQSIYGDAFWPVFSPGGEYLAVQAFDWEGEEGAGRYPVNQRLTIYSLKEESWVPLVLDLTSFDQDALFITDWR